MLFKGSVIYKEVDASDPSYAKASWRAYEAPTHQKVRIYRIYQIWYCQACPHVDIHDRYLVRNKVHRKLHLLCSLTWMKHDGVLSLRNFLTCLHQRKGSRSFSFYVPSTFAVRQSCFFFGPVPITRHHSLGYKCHLWLHLSASCLAASILNSVVFPTDLQKNGRRPRSHKQKTRHTTVTTDSTKSIV